MKYILQYKLIKSFLMKFVFKNLKNDKGSLKITNALCHQNKSDINCIFYFYYRCLVLQSCLCTLSDERMEFKISNLTTPLSSDIHKI